MSWVERAIGDFGRVVTGKTPSTKVPEFFDGEYLFVTPTDLNFGNYYVSQTERTVTEKARGQFKNQFIPKDAIMFTCIGNTIGKCGISNGDCLTNQQINSIVPNEDYDAKFLYYLLHHNRETIRGIGIGGGSATPIINKSTFSGVKFLVLEGKEQQKSIASILSAYDDLIENNRRRIALLEEAAQQLCKEWFVRFHFPGYEHVPLVEGVPDGWEVRSVCEVISEHVGGGWGQEESLGSETEPAFVIRGTDIPQIAVGKFDAVELRYHKPSSLTKRVLEPGDIIFEISGGSTTQPVARALLISSKMLSVFPEKVICASFCKRLSVGDEKLATYIYRKLVEDRGNGSLLIYQKESASALKNFNFKAFLAGYMVAIPPKTILDRFAEQVSVIALQQSTLTAQISASAKARNLLLPKLMNGELVV